MASRKRPLRRKGTLTEKAYEVIKWGILRGDIPEGAFLSEAEVRKKYGIGRTPFREACNRLHHERLLEVVPRRGYLVSEISFRSVREIFEVRLILESVIAELAAQRASPEEIEELECWAKRWRSSAGTNDSHEEMLKSNSEFHVRIAQMTHNRELVRLVTSILEQIARPSYYWLRTLKPRKTDIAAHHELVLEALRRRDSLAARKATIGDLLEGQLDALGTGRWKSDEEWGPSSFLGAGQSPAGKADGKIPGGDSSTHSDHEQL